MRHKNAAIIIGVVSVFVVGTIAGVCAFVVGAGNSQASQEQEASATVTAFGQEMQQVSILAPDASSTIAADYSQYVAPELLQQWEENPDSAPGRVVSSPWPDHIQIDSITPQGQGYVVDGELVFMTSNNIERGGNAGTAPIVIQLSPVDGQMLIVAFEGQNDP